MHLVSAQEADDDALTMEPRRQLSGKRGGCSSVTLMTGGRTDQLEYRLQTQFCRLLAVDLIAHKQELHARGAPVQLTQSGLQIRLSAGGQVQHHHSAQLADRFD